MKRPLFHQFFSIWLALLVLTASVGLTVQQHTCLLSGAHSAAIVFQPAQHGCPPARVKQEPDQTRAAQLTRSCCEFGAHFHKLDTPSAHLAWVKAPVPALLPGWPVAPHPVPYIAAVAARWFAAHSSPPPLGGRTLLTFGGILVV
ncbi:hypothetical protein [Hymenobacter rubripertinctus]|uniref:Uncharacterized protein n=1 Tax=Hymenobacter rubripertinctus TaxID=2029981 RepID=A0A418QSP0_9BACT|nr:hypothetical protein [Hymenobacter rubripertinctus]RIY08287.1 hypothetical protein D0T11_14700 [Hymenobacter rubripertinctus]